MAIDDKYNAEAEHKIFMYYNYTIIIVYIEFYN